jgi:hypothetical protein
MNWSAMIEDEVDRTFKHPDIAWAFEDWKTTKSYAFYGPAVRTAFTAGAEWVLARLAEWDQLTEAEAIEELRRGDRSVFHPLFKHDPRVWVDCPRDGRITVGPEGTCDRCLFDFTKE